MEIVNQTRYFDLNIEEILDNWKIHHGIREIISNALDEQLQLLLKFKLLFVLFND